MYCKELCSVSHKWKFIGLELRHPGLVTLENIMAQYPGDPTERLCEMLECWLKSTDPDPTWERLATVHWTAALWERNSWQDN